MVLFAGAGVAHNNDVVHDAGRAQRRLEADADTRGRGRLGVVARTTRVAERQRGQRQGRAGRGAQSVRHDAPLTCDASVVLLTGPLRRESPRRGDGTACAAPGGAARAAQWRPNPRAPVCSLSHPPSSPRLLSVPSCGCAAPALTFFFFCAPPPAALPCWWRVGWAATAVEVAAGVATAVAAAAATVAATTTATAAVAVAAAAGVAAAAMANTTGASVLTRRRSAAARVNGGQPGRRTPLAPQPLPRRRPLVPPPPSPPPPLPPLGYPCSSAAHPATGSSGWHGMRAQCGFPRVPPRGQERRPRWSWGGGGDAGQDHASGATNLWRAPFGSLAADAYGGATSPVTAVVLGRAR